MEEQRTALEQCFPMEQVSAYEGETQVREREELRAKIGLIYMITKMTDVHKRDFEAP